MPPSLCQPYHVPPNLPFPCNFACLLSPSSLHQINTNHTAHAHISHMQMQLCASYVRVGCRSKKTRCSLNKGMTRWGSLSPFAIPAFSALSECQPRGTMKRKQAVGHDKTIILRKKIILLVQPLSTHTLLLTQTSRPYQQPHNRTSLCYCAVDPSIWCRLKLSKNWKRRCVKWWCASAALCKQLTRSDSHIHRASTHSAASGSVKMSVVCWVLA